MHVCVNECFIWRAYKVALMVSLLLFCRSKRTTRYPLPPRPSSKKRDPGKVEKKRSSCSSTQQKVYTTPSSSTTRHFFQYQSKTDKQLAVFALGGSNWFRIHLITTLDPTINKCSGTETAHRSWTNVFVTPEDNEKVDW